MIAELESSGLVCDPDDRESPTELSNPEIFEYPALSPDDAGSEADNMTMHSEPSTLGDANMSPSGDCESGKGSTTPTDLDQDTHDDGFGTDNGSTTPRDADDALVRELQDEFDKIENKGVPTGANLHAT